MKIILYLKTHNKTGLKYLGKTTQDPFTYLGSGKRWQNHLKKHGNDITTKILLETDDPVEISKWGTYYSNLWNIVKSKDFANLKLESGDGGDTSMCESYRKGIKMRDTSGNKNSMYGRSAIIENSLKWYNNGIENLYVTKGTQPRGFKPGRIIDYKKPHTKETKTKLAQYGTKSCVSPKGEIFKSRKEAAKTYGVSPSAIGGLIARGVSGWRWSS